MESRRATTTTHNTQRIQEALKHAATPVGESRRRVAQIVPGTVLYCVVIVWSREVLFYLTQTRHKATLPAPIARDKERPLSLPPMSDTESVEKSRRCGPDGISPDLPRRSRLRQWLPGRSHNGRSGVARTQFGNLNR